MIKIVLVDDHELILNCLRQQLSKIEFITVIETFTNTTGVLDYLKKNECDILITDLMIKEQSGIDLVKKINEEIQSKIKVILLSGFYDKMLHKHALELGVKAFIQKEASYEELVSAILSVHNNNILVPDTLIDECVKPILTVMELKVIDLVVREYKNEEIAKELFLSKRTVESHINSICNKLKVNSRIGAVREVIRLGII